ncbi:hypothetical protein MFRU_018g01300 [Monilinia fructicola]|uniref:Uncharacterized protein n=1 Tax=Monilinia fructicola TaxID=38448 RepID=A0A5M9JUK2_MONFR|nr:hypothetical protein EYC84_002049 [Monilinia fructicola]KAG4029025.1 hypothetical protein MFRU_018g01300 [Monilinia fructicola]
MILDEQHYGNNVILADGGEEKPLDVVPTFHAPNLDWMNSAINQTISFDSTLVSPETAPVCSSNAKATLTFPPRSSLYFENFDLGSQGSSISNTGMPDFDIPIASIEPFDSDHPSAEDAIVAEPGIDLSSQDQIDWGSFGLESIPWPSDNHAHNEQIGIDFRGKGVSITVIPRA